MNTSIYYFTGTGNSLYVARKLAGKLGNSQLISIPQTQSMDSIEASEVLGIVCPIYMHNIPWIVVDFIRKIQNTSYVFLVFAGAGDLGCGMKIARKLFADQQINLDSAFSVTLPSNYTPFGATPEEKKKEQFQNLEKRINEIAPIISAKKTHKDKSNTSWFRRHIHPALYYKLGYNRINILDQSFWVEEQCNGCSFCEKVCPVNNISMENDTPHWNGNCQQCHACLQWCPQEAIQYGKQSKGVKRYHHPSITINDIIESSTIT